MTFKKYRHLKKLALSVGSFNEFINEAAKWPRRYAIVSPHNWTKANYEWFYNRIKGGHNYVTLFNDDAKAA